MNCIRAGGSLTTTECGHLRPQTPVKDSGSLMTTKCGHLRPQNLIFTDRANKTSTVHGVTCDHRMRSLTTTKHFHNRTTEGGGVGGGGVGGMITYLGLHTDTPKGDLVYRLWACTHAGPFWWVGVGWGGMITYHKALLQYYSALQSTTPYYKVLLESTTPVPLLTTKYNSSTSLYYSSTTPHQTLCSGCLPQISANAAPANKSDTPTSPKNNALATRSETPT